MFRTISLVALIGLGSALLASPTAHAYRLMEPNMKWYSTPVMVEFNSLYPEGSVTDGDWGKAAMTDSFFDPVDGWNGAGSGTLLDGRILARNAVLNDGRPTVQFTDPNNYCTGSCLATTVTYYSIRLFGLEEIEDADIFFSDDKLFTSENEDPNPNQCDDGGWLGGGGEAYIEGVLQHELGHLLGLDHSLNSNATMYATIGSCDNTRDELIADDKNGVNYLY